MSEEGQVTDEGTGAGEGAGEGEGEGGKTVLGGEGEGAGEGAGTGEGTGEGEGSGEGEGEGEAGVPETYEFNMPEGMELDQALADAAQPVFKELNDWGDELKKDQVFGGEAFKENSDKTFQFIEKTMPDDLKPLLLGPEGLFDQTGIGQHPALVKYFFHLSQKFPVSEDDPGRGEGGDNKPGTPEARLYPNEAKKTG